MTSSSPPMQTAHRDTVYAAQRDTWLLSESLAELLDTTPVAGDSPRRVLEIGTGGGTLALQAATGPGTVVTAVDLSPEALLTTGLRACRAGVSVRLLLSDLVESVRDETFDVIVSNPPYVPAPEACVPTRGPARAWDAGLDGRAVLDRLCRRAPRVLAPGGCLLIVQSALSDVDASRTQLEAEGLTTSVVARCTLPFGPVLHSRVDYLEEAGFIEPGCRTEELAVIRAQG